MSLATLRILMVFRGRAILAALIGFVEASCYITALSQVVKHVDNPINLLFYAGGFATGTYIGGMIENFIALGYVNVQIISVEFEGQLQELLRENGFGVTEVEGSGKDGTHNILYVLLKRRDLPRLMKLIEGEDKKAFISVMDTRKIVGGFFPRRKAK
ncbi:MAG TPA: DUF2179 domain-containing protein [Firmicutes bacterium]|jgi:uncharacterized protein YebE (UPF0316 family)|nr:DUF2179 domain-containing protein [Bacillota bacterium]